MIRVNTKPVPRAPVYSKNEWLDRICVYAKLVQCVSDHHQLKRNGLLQNVCAFKGTQRFA